jgi:arabinogalactan oligomer / maltooligosaccharide transport system permease protein
MAATAPAVDRARPPSREGRVRRFLRAHWYAYAMLVPVAVVMLVLVGYPLARGVFLSLTDATARNVGNRFLPPSYELVGLKNYTDLLTGEEGNFYPVLVRTVIWTAANVFFHYVIGLGLALMLHRELRGRTLYRILLLVPWAVPTYVAAFGWRYMFNGDYGLFNQLLGGVGLPPLAWLNGPVSALVAVIMVNVWLGVPFMMVALLGGLQSINQDLYEAASIDGASALQRFRYITLPGLRSVSTTVILLGTIWTFNMFNVIYLITRGGPFNSTNILSTYAYIKFFDQREFAVAAAYGVLIMSLLLVFATAYQRVTRRDQEAWA